MGYMPGLKYLLDSKRALKQAVKQEDQYLISLAIDDCVESMKIFSQLGIFLFGFVSSFALVINFLGTPNFIKTLYWGLVLGWAVVAWLGEKALSKLYRKKLELKYLK